MKYIGAHVSIAGGVENAPLNAQRIGAKAFAMFTKNQRQWKSRQLTPDTIKAFNTNLTAVGINKDHVLVHDSYLINLGNPDGEKRKKSIDAFIDEAKRVDQLGLTLLNFHPGSHLKLISEEKCIELVAGAIQQAILETTNVVFVIETTAGQGSNIGYTFEQIASMINRVGMDSRVGVCIDTCHVYTAGYDIKNNYHRVMDDFESIIGFEFLKGVHLNDSKSNLGQKLDRHHSIGAGALGWDCFKNIMKDPRFENIPMTLETINSDLWPEEIEKLYELSS